MRLEPLEDRRLLAHSPLSGPELAGIQLNDGTLLKDGQVYNVAPQDLTFYFNDEIDPSTLDGIRVTRAGLDGTFRSARAASDFNTNGATVLEFTSSDSGVSGNDTSIEVIKNALGVGVGPRISVMDDTIFVELNTTAESQTTAGELRDAINRDPDASELVTASIRFGRSPSTNIAAPQIDYSPIVIHGANAASVASNFNAGRSVEIEFTAKTAGKAGNDIEIVVTKVDRRGVAPPRVSVTDKTIFLELNSSAASPTSAGEVVAAINNHPEARGLVTALQTVGRDDASVGNRVINFSPLRMVGVDDVVIEPGFIGLGDSPQQVVMRFKEPLPDDIYHVEVVGTGQAALRNLDGVAFGDETEDGLDNGTDFDLLFELNLGAQVLAVVPQPVSRNFVTGNLTQARNQIRVYFNEDDLHPTRVVTGQLDVDPTVVDPDFYELTFTNDTVQNTDDILYRPKAIEYDPVADLATLFFDAPLEGLNGPGTFRLRIGTDEVLPLAPMVSTAAAASVGSDFNTQAAVEVTFTATQDFARQVAVLVKKADMGGPASPTVAVAGQQIVVTLNTQTGNESTARELVDAVNTNAEANQLVVAAVTSGDPAAEIATGATDGTRLPLVGLGSSFASASDLGILADQGQVISSAIEAQLYDLPFPGALDEPGHRDLRTDLDRHFLDDAGDRVSGITTAFYNFQDEYGFDPEFNVLNNAITEAQKQRAREVFSLYSEYLGIQFVETANQGMTIVTGDMRAVDPDAANGPGGVIGIAGGGLTGLAVMDLQDFSNPLDDQFGGAWFETAIHEIGHLLGMGHMYELPPLTVMGEESALAFPENTIEPIFPGATDIIHGQHLFRPEGKDIDLYQFELVEKGRFSAETFAERLTETSLLDTVISLYREDGQGQRTLMARNDDYYSNDSYVELDLEPGTYWVAVTARGNEDIDPSLEDTGLGGRSEGAYDLRLNFRSAANRSIRDATGVPLDGDADGIPGGVSNFWFRAQEVSRTIYVDKAAPDGGNGSLVAPFQLISLALADAKPGELVRILGNGGEDGNLATVEDNLAYEIGFNQLGTVLADGPRFDVPRGVTVVIDEGAVIKLRRARIGVGSSSAIEDRSGGALQVLGTPILLDVFGSVLRDRDGIPIPGSVYFTSILDDELGESTNLDSLAFDAAPGDWGGIRFRNDIDGQDKNRLNYEEAGIFLNVVNQADIRYGGGNVMIDGIPRVVTPIQMTDARPTASFNRITLSADAAISATPNSFAETNFQAPQYQFTPFTSDYTRIGPDIFGNIVTDNSLNGLFVRVTTPAGNDQQAMTVSGRWDDTNLPHVLAERLVVEGTPGGAILELDTPAVQLVTLSARDGGQLEDGTYNYRVVFVDDGGNEGAPSGVTSSITIDGTNDERSVQLENLPQAAPGFPSRRLYRSDKTANASGVYVLIAELNATATSYADDGVSLDQVLSTGGVTGLRPRLDARLAIDPGVVVKLNGGGIEATFGADLYAEGQAGRNIIFTSIRDQRYGAGGTFDTADENGFTTAGPGDWGGIFAGHTTRVSLDYAVVAYGGGEMNIEGTFAGFNALEIHQAEARVARTLFEQNAAGVGGQSDANRVGRGFNRESTIFVRGAQPVIVENTLLGNAGSAISIDANSLDYRRLVDYGRSTYGKNTPDDPMGIVEVGLGNQGPLVRLNRLEDNDVNGMQVRGTTLTTEGVWDDTDIVHVLRDESVNAPDLHTYGGLRLESSPTESLVVKLDGASAGVTATGRPLEIDDRIGGSVQIVGQPGHPVVLTSIEDCTVGAGFTPAGEPQNDTINSGACPATTTTVPYVDVVVVADESGSMFFSQQFTKGLITDLEAALVSSGIGDGTSGINQYGLVGFGGSGSEEPGHGHPVGQAGASFGTAVEYVTAVDTLALSGVLEDGYSGIQYALDNYPFREDAEKFIILATDEDRDIVEPQLTFATTLIGLNAADVRLEAILGVNILDTLGIAAVAGDSQGIAYLPDGQGGFTTSPLGAITTSSLFSPNSVVDYADLSFAAGGIVGDIDLVATGTGGPVTTSFSNAMVTQILVQAGGGRRGDPGDWDSVRLEEYSHDRNVEVIVESEATDLAAPGNNATVDLAQYVGALAKNEKSGDENLRLGFEIQGTLNAPEDVDMYSFTGAAGTEVWLDIDRTANRLDTVVELVDAAGRVLARSDDSAAEAADPDLLFSSSLIPEGSVNPLRKAGYDPGQPDLESAFEIRDLYTTNPRDAGMRIVLPGQPGSASVFHVRVRNGAPGGFGSGNYQLQIRLQELDEFPGSTVRYADIRYATNGIEILGQPIHSPLIGEATEIESLNPFTGAISSGNSTLATAQDIGNLLQTDRGALSVAGDISFEDDVDFYRMTIDYDSIQGAALRPFLSTVFDIDYAD
ncbi:MAG: hypothetical protein ACC628_13390 [Pirellulaceae bacterium]